MAPKRPASSSSSSSPSVKKAKLSTGQKSLHSFFRPPSKTGDRSSGREGSGPSLEIGDRELAEKLAEQDGIDLETAKRLEDSWSNGRSGDNASDAIEVDLDEPSSGNISIRPISPPRSGSSNTKRLATHANNHISDSPLPSSSNSPEREGRTKLAQPLSSMSPRSLDIGSQPPVILHYAPLGVDPISFDIKRYPPWLSNSPTPYSFLVHALVALSQTRSRIQILNILTNCLRTILLYHPQSLLPSLYLLSNSLSPAYSPVELGLGHTIISKAIQQVSGLTPAALSKLYKSLGDPGDVAFTAKSSVRTLVPHPALSVAGVYDTLLKISRVQGQGAAKQKQSLVEILLLSAKGEESRYLVRTLFQNLRVGAVRTTILSALARALVLNPPAISSSTRAFYASSELLTHVRPLVADVKKKADTDPARQEVMKMFDDAEALVRRVFVQHPNLNDIVAALLEDGLDGLSDRVPLTVGIPLHPTLGSPMRSLDEVYERLNGLPFAAEQKLDGQRAQVHASDDNGALTVKVFSRHLEDMTDKYPDIVALVELLFASHSNLSSFILDAEIVAVDRETGALKSFQDLSQRARKGVQLNDVKVAVQIFLFDLMYFNGEILLKMPFRERRDSLRRHFPPVTPDNVTVARLGHVECCESEDGRTVVEAFWQQAVAGRSEGIMVKLLDNGEVTELESPSKNGKTRKPLPATYEPDKRTSAWLKLKRDYVTGLGDSLDLVPIGGWHGNGRKSKWWSPVLLGLWDAASGEFVAVCKCMSGFSDEFYKAMRERFSEESETCSKSPLWNCRTGGFKPSVYFKPQEVWETRGADITLSPVSVAALGMASESRGLSLRFPRFIKVRDDKGLEQASTPEFLANMWRVQENRGKNPKGVDEGELIDAEWESEAPEEEAEDSS